MSPLILTIVMLLISAGMMGGAYLTLSRGGSSRSRASIEEGLRKVGAANKEIESLLKSKDSFIGPKQFDSIQKQHGELVATLDTERASLKQIEEKLDTAQKQVEKKEAEQQEVKSAKEEDLIKLQELTTSYGDISRESVQLEQRLASSLKNLDKILGEAELTTSQREMFVTLQQAVEAAGGRLRDLLMEYEKVNERLNMLQQQLGDLEVEYTRLVEQQLGE